MSLTPEQETAARKIKQQITAMAEREVIGRAQRPNTLRVVEDTFEQHLRRLGATDVHASARNAWSCRFPLPRRRCTECKGHGEVRNPAWRPTNRGLACPTSDNGSLAVTDPGGEPLFLTCEECHGEGWVQPECGFTSHADPLGEPLRALKRVIWGYPGRCPLHGWKLEGYVDLTMDLQLPRPVETVVATVVVA